MRDAGILGQRGEAHRRGFVDRLRPTGVHITDWIVAEGGEVHDRIEPRQIGGGELANILVDLGDRGAVRGQGAVAEIVRIEPGNIPAGFDQCRGHD
jgi:hypothetical protein